MIFSNLSRSASPRGISPRSVSSTGRSGGKSPRGLKGSDVRLQPGGAGRIPTGLGENVTTRENLTPRGGLGVASVGSPGISSTKSPRSQAVMGRLTPRGDGGRLPMELVGGDAQEARSEEELIRLEVRLLEDQLRAELAKKLREEKGAMMDPRSNQEEAERKARQERDRETRKAMLEGRIQSIEEEQRLVAAKWEEVPSSVRGKREDPARQKQSNGQKDPKKNKYGKHDTLHVSISIVGAKDLPKSKIKGNPNSYCIGGLSSEGSAKIKTSVVEDSRKPVWNKPRGVIVVAPGDKFELSVWDKDFPEDDLLGCARLSPEDLLAVVPGGDVYLYQEGKKLPGKITLNVEVVSIDHAKHVRVTVIGAENLPAADLGETSDPYLKCEVPGKPKLAFQTPVIKQTLAPIWNHTHDFPDLSTSDCLAMTVLDQDPAGDEMLGRVMLLPTHFMLKGFAGKVALQDCGVGVDDAKLDLKIEVFEPGFATSSMKIRVVIVKATNLPAADEGGTSDPYCVCEVLGKKGEKCQTPVMSGTLAPRWDFSHDFVGFSSGDSLQFTLWDEDPEGNEMLGRAVLQGSQIDPDGYEGSLVLQDTGLNTQSTLSVEVDVLQSGSSANSSPPVNQSAGSPNVHEVLHGGRIRVTIVSARGLREADEDGGSDPYCVCEVQGKKACKFKTDVIEDSLNPLWNHSHEFSGVSSKDVLMLMVWDQDEAGDDLLGRAQLKPEQFLPDGFEGSLDLEEAGDGIRATLKLKVEVLESVPDQKSGNTHGTSKGSSQANRDVKEKLLEAGQLECVIVGASALRKAEFGHSDPFCVCEVEGRKKFTFETKVIRHSTNPSWNHSHKWDNFPLGKSLVFTVWSKDTIENERLGKATLHNDRFNPNGFDGELKLEDAGHRSASKLAVKVYLPPPPVFEAKAGAAIGVGELGFALLLPPGRVFISQVQDSSWAEKHLIQDGTEIVSVNGRKAKEMSVDLFVDAMQGRPLHLTLQPASVQAKDVMLSDLRKPYEGFLSHAKKMGGVRNVKESAREPDHEGVILECAPPDGDDDADVYATPSSNEIVREVKRGALLMAAGPSIDAAGIVMMPVRPRGAVELECFKTVELIEGSVLICAPPFGDEEDVEIYGSMDSFGVLGKVEKGEKLIAAGPAKYVKDTVLVPVKPAGAVELDFFRLGHAIVTTTSMPMSSAYAMSPPADQSKPPASDPASTGSSAALKTVKIQVKIIGAKGLRGADFNGFSDPYSTCEVPGKKNMKFKTPVIKKSLNPVWNFEHEFVSFFPTDSLLFKVWDKDFLRDDFLGKVELEATVFMLRGFEGDLVLQDAGKDIHATLQVSINIDQPFGEGALRPMGIDGKQMEHDTSKENAGSLSSKYRARVTLIGAQGLANDSSEAYCVCKVLGRKELTFKTPVDTNSNAPRWNHKHDLVGMSTSDSIQFSVFDQDDSGGDDLLGKVTIKGDKFIPHGFVGTLELEDGDEGATLSVMLEVQSTASKVRDNPRGDTSKEKSAFRVTIIGANGLASASSDTYCVCKVPGRKDLTFKTSVVMDSRAPRWNHEHDLPNLSSNDMLQFSIFDKDDGGDDLLGRAVIDYTDFCRDGFVGTLPLEDGEEHASLSIMVETLSTRAMDDFGDSVASSRKDQHLVGHGDNASISGGGHMDSSPKDIPKKHRVDHGDNASISGDRHMDSSPKDIPKIKSKKKGIADITKGTVLICEPPPEDDNRTAEVYASPHSAEVVDTLQEGETIIASGVPVDVDGSIMVPVKPDGAVDVTLFRIGESPVPSDASQRSSIAKNDHKPLYDSPSSSSVKHKPTKRASITAGTILICSPPPGFSSSVEIFESPYEQNVIASVQEGEEVVAAGPPEDVNGEMMVSIRPQGAVELIAFRVGDDMSDDGNDPLTKTRSTSGASSDLGISAIISGNVLTCIPPPEYKNRIAEVFVSPNSSEVIRELQEGDQVVVSGPPENVKGNLMVPVRPRGAVEMNLFQVSESLTLVVGDEVQSLGMFPLEPPGRVEVEEVIPGSWAEDVGISPGDEIVLLNDKRAEEMEAEEFFESIQSRPLVIVVYPIEIPGETNQKSDSQGSDIDF